MSRILNPAESRWYDEIKAVSYYGETELEWWIRQHAKSLFPHHHLIPFKKKVARRKSAEIKKPDFALITHDFSAWVVVEVELEEHGVNHVLDQTRVFIDGTYNPEQIAQYVRDQFLKFHKKRVSCAKLKSLFEKSHPSVLVIADEHAENWQKELKKLGVNYCIFEIYKNASNRHLYRIHGEYPTVYVNEAQCRPVESIGNLLEVIGNFTFNKKGQEGSVDILCDEVLTRWTLFTDGGKQYLRLKGKKNPLTLSPHDTYGLFRDKSNKYFFKRS